MIKGISHISFRSSDMEKTVAFYCGVLGFKDAFDFDKPNGEKWLKFIKIADGQFLEMLYRYEGPDHGCVYSHICLEVDDIQKTAQHLRDHNIPLEKEPALGVTGNWTCWASDPDGNQIEFVQIMPDSLHAKA